MDYTAFEYTRDIRNDYSWRTKPKILPESFYKVIQQFIYLRDQLRDNENLAWDKIFLFLKYEGLNIVCQAVTNGEDYVGRVIYSVRGLISLNDDYRSLLGIPDLINYIWGEGYPAYENDDEVTVHIEDKINPLIRTDEDLFDEELRCNSFRKLISDIRAGEGGYGIIVGPGAGAVYGSLSNFHIEGTRVFTACYDFEEDCNYTEYENISVPFVTFSDDVSKDIRSADNKTSLYIKLVKEGKTDGYYEWILVRQSDGLMIKSSKQRINKNISMEQLISEMRRIKRYYSLIGLDIS